MNVALLTCDRYEYTRQTVDSLLEHNDVSGWRLFYADDASTDKRIRPYVESKGFEPLVLNAERIGCSPTTDKLIQAVAERVPADSPLLYLQNDFASVRPLPPLASLLSDPQVGFVQLSHRRPHSRLFRRTTWEPFGELDGERLWKTSGSVGNGVGYHPTMAQVGRWAYFLVGVRRERQFVRRTMSAGLGVVRPEHGVFFHIGHQTTPDGLFGRRRRTDRMGSKRDRQRRRALARWSLAAEERAAVLATIPQAGAMLEIGTWCGASVREWAGARPDVQFLSVDPLACRFSDAALYHWQANRLPNMQLMLGESRKCLPQLADKTFDTILVDGDHSMAACLDDLQQAHRLLKDGGQLLAHDYISPTPRNAGVTIAVDEFCKQRGWRVARVEGLLAVLERTP